MVFRIFSLNADWMKTYGGEYLDVGSCVIETGYTWSFGAGWADVLLIKVEPS